MSKWRIRQYYFKFIDIVVNKAVKKKKNLFSEKRHDLFEKKSFLLGTNEND